jgi:hypothetical protein
LLIKTMKRSACILGFLMVAACSACLGQGTAFTYQGRLNVSAQPANGTYDFRFGLFDALSGGNQDGSYLTNMAVPVTNGLFTVMVDFGDEFPGSNRWFDIGVRTNGYVGPFTSLTPRQTVTPVPYAITASNVSGTIPVSQLSGVLSSAQLPLFLATNSGANFNLSGVFDGSSVGTNFQGVTGLVSALGGATPYANAFYSGVPIGLDTWPAHGPVFTSSQFTNEILAIASECPQALFASPMPFWFVIDEGWAQTNSDGSLYRDADGKLAMNPILWGDTPSNYLAFAHAHRVAVMLYTQFFGPGGPVNGYGNPYSMGTNIELDAQTIASWGFDGIKADLNGDSTSPLSDLERLETAFRQSVTNRTAYFMSDIGTAYQTFPGSVDNALLGGALSGTLFCPNTDWAYPTPSINYMALITNIHVCASMPQISGQGTWFEPRDLLNNITPIAISYTAEKMHAILGAAMRFTLISYAEYDEITPFTNNELWQVQQDPLRQVGEPLPGIGSPDTYEVWTKNMADGSTCQAWLNCTTNATYTITLNWTNFGHQNGEPFLVRDVFNTTNIGVFSNSLTLTVTNEDCYLLRFYPLSNPAFSGLAAAPVPTSGFYGLAGRPWTNTASSQGLATITFTWSGASASATLVATNIGGSAIAVPWSISGVAGGAGGTVSLQTQISPGTVLNLIGTNISASASSLAWQ